MGPLPTQAPYNPESEQKSEQDRRSLNESLGSEDREAVVSGALMEVW